MPEMKLVHAASSPAPGQTVVPTGNGDATLIAGVRPAILARSSCTGDLQPGPRPEPFFILLDLLQERYS